MVLIHLKKAEKDEFLFETSVETQVDVVTKELVKIHNLRCRTRRLVDGATDLAAYGPMKTPEEQGLDEDTPLLSDVQEDGTMKSKETKPPGPHHNPDPANRRNGDAPSPQLKEVIKRTVDEARTLTSMKMVETKQPLTSKMLMDAIDSIRGAVMICYPMGLPQWDVVKQILDEQEEDVSTQEEMDPDATMLWWANKELQREKVMREYVGKVGIHH